MSNDSKSAALRSKAKEIAAQQKKAAPSKDIPTDLADLQEAPYNPRTITQAQFDGLKMSLDEYGDISGITWNKRTGFLVSGHQRVRALVEAYGEAGVEVTAHGLSTPDHVFPIRVVDWDSTQERLANIAANSTDISGQFDYEALSAQLKELELEGIDLSLAGLMPETLEPLLAAEWTSLPSSSEESDTDEGNGSIEEHWEGMPEYENEDVAFRSVIVHFRCQKDVQDFENLLGQKLTTDKTKFMWHPVAHRIPHPTMEEEEIVHE
jgi:hypothetical protein